jgi:hypothetical protein
MKNLWWNIEAAFTRENWLRVMSLILDQPTNGIAYRFIVTDDRLSRALPANLIACPMSLYSSDRQK